MGKRKVTNSEFIYEQNISNQKELINILKKKINTWANELDYHPYKNLGDKIEVKELWYKPAFPITFRTQYEARSKHKGYKPYIDQKIPKLEIIELNELKEWERDLGKIEDFINDASDYIVNGSQTVDNCFKCNALGWIKCVECHGEKKITCPNCNGYKYIRCSSCSGEGNHKCSSCSGKGYFEEKKENYRIITDSDGRQKRELWDTEIIRNKCSACRGKGKIECSSCSGKGQVICYKCSGMGKITCPKCSGSGRNTCPVCNGYQKLMHYFYIHRELCFIRQHNVIIHNSVFNEFPEFKDKCDSIKSVNIHSHKDEMISTDYLPDENHLSEFVSEFVNNSITSKENNKKILFQQLDINKIDVYEMHYLFNNKQYVILFYGDNYEIIPGKSPIYEVAISYWDNALKSYKKRNYSHAWELINKANKINIYEEKENIKNTLAIIEKKLDDSYRFGSMLGSWLAAFFLTFIAYTYFTKVNWVFEYSNFINHPDNFLYDFHSYANIIVIILLSFISGSIAGNLTKKLKSKIPIAIGRVTVGFVSSIILVLLFSMVWVLLNATGITITITFLLWLTIWLLKIIIMVLGIIISIIVFLAGLVWGIIVWIYELFF